MIFGLMPLMRLLDATWDPCNLVASLSSVTAVNEELYNCFGGEDNGWWVSGTTNLGALPDGVEYYIEIARDSAGTSFSYWGRRTDDWDEYDNQIGADGLGGSITRYVKWKVWVVPTGKGTGDACSGPVMSNQVSRTANACYY
jgi:hypothetical protein